MIVIINNNTGDYNPKKDGTTIMLPPVESA
jgi:hypothetical protein